VGGSGQSLLRGTVGGTTGYAHLGPAKGPFLDPFLAKNDLTFFCVRRTPAPAPGNPLEWVPAGPPGFSKEACPHFGLPTGHLTPKVSLWGVPYNGDFHLKNDYVFQRVKNTFSGLCRIHNRGGGPYGGVCTHAQSRIFSTYCWEKASGPVYPSPV